MIINESYSNQNLYVDGILVNRNGKKYRILEVNGHNYLLDGGNGNYVIALGYDSKSKEWAQGKYFTDKKNAYKVWDKIYSKKNAFGVDLGESYLVESIKPYNRDKNFEMFYLGEVDSLSTDEIENYGKSHGSVGSLLGK